MVDAHATLVDEGVASAVTVSEGRAVPEAAREGVTSTEAVTEARAVRDALMAGEAVAHRVLLDERRAVRLRLPSGGDTEGARDGCAVALGERVGTGAGVAKPPSA